MQPRTLIIPYFNMKLLKPLIALPHPNIPYAKIDTIAHCCVNMVHRVHSQHIVCGDNINKRTTPQHAMWWQHQQANHPLG